MTTLTDPPKEQFRLSMLLYDTRYRSMTIQVIALIFFMLAAAWLINNTATNLADLGKEPSFKFLSEPAGYDINQRLIEYNSQYTHLRAAFVGLLNTLLVAVLGCIAATIVGVIVGVLRLSNNWLVSKVMTVYVEAFRNVPVLLWIVFIMAILIETLPAPRAFKGETPAAQMSFFDSVAVTNQGVFIPRLAVAEYAWLILVALILSIVAIVYIRRRADRIQEATGDRPKTLLLSIATLIVPMVLAYVVASVPSRNNELAFVASGVTSGANISTAAEEVGRFDYCISGGSAKSLQGLKFLETGEVPFRRKDYFGRSEIYDSFAEESCNLVVVDADNAQSVATMLTERLGGDKTATVIPVDLYEGSALQINYPAMVKKGIPRFEGGTHVRNSLIALWLALSLYTAAFIAEIVRAGILAISKGQTEAAAALGLRSNRIMSLVILPQALRVIIPPLISNYLNLTKNSSLAIAVGYMDITGTLGGITLNQTGRELETLLLLMLIYLVISLSISAVMNWYNESVKLKER